MATLSALGCSPESELFVSHCWAFSARGSLAFCKWKLAKLEISLRSKAQRLVLFCQVTETSITGRCFTSTSSCVSGAITHSYVPHGGPRSSVVSGRSHVPWARQSVYLSMLSWESANPTPCWFASTLKVRLLRFLLVLLGLPEHRFRLIASFLFLPDSFWNFLSPWMSSLSANIQVSFSLRSYSHIDVFLMCSWEW